MREVLAIHQGGRWLALETNEDAISAQQVTQTAIGHFFRSELQRRAAGLEPMEYLVLEASDGSIPVCMRIGIRDAETLVTGFRNSDPYPAHGDAIEELALHLGRTLSNAYPYGPDPIRPIPRP